MIDHSNVKFSRTCPVCGSTGIVDTIPNDLVSDHKYDHRVVCRECQTIWCEIVDEFGFTVLHDTIWKYGFPF